VIPQIIGAAAAAGGATATSATLRRSAALSTGEYSVMHFARDAEQLRLIAIETHEPAVA
jgi:8-oxo-dGTP diphosphatase